MNHVCRLGSCTMEWPVRRANVLGDTSAPTGRDRRSGSETQQGRYDCSLPSAFPTAALKGELWRLHATLCLGDLVSWADNGELAMD